MGRLREAVTELIARLPHVGALLRRRSRESQLLEIEELARCIVDYGHMSADSATARRILVEVPDLAYRFRETHRVVTQALRLLESQGRAWQTEVDGLWKLEV